MFAKYHTYLLLESLARSVRQVMEQVFPPSFYGIIMEVLKKGVSVCTDQTRTIRCLLYGFVDYYGKRTKSFDVLTSDQRDQEFDVGTATYGPDQSRRAK